MAFTEKEVIQALECCKDDDGCTDCPYYDEKDEHEQICVYRLHKDILDLIKRQQAEIKKYKGIVRYLRKEK